jgi:MFS family permease
MTADQKQKTRTLWLAGILHAFTHIYHVALLPLYLLIQRDLKLTSVSQATLLVTVMMLAYVLPSFGLGVLADRLSRKKLLGTGLAVNALGYITLALAPSYGWALFSVALAGFGGSFFHPAATALVARLYPAGTGKALGLVGIGASIGFFIGPLYAGWRAADSGWRAPVFELGLLGLVMAGIFAWLAQNEAGVERKAKPIERPSEKMFPSITLWVFFIGAAFAFGLRDFTGSGMGSLGSLFLQKAHGFDPKLTGLALSGIFIASAISNPFFGGLSDRGRIRWTSLVLVASALLVGLFPHVPAQWTILVLAVYGFFFMASYPMVEAALMESVHDSVRGRVFGFFLTVCGLTGNLSHWLAGAWVKKLGARAYSPDGYYSLYTQLAALVLLSLAGLPCLHAIRRREEAQIATDHRRDDADAVSQPAARVPNPPQSLA